MFEGLDRAILQVWKKYRAMSRKFTFQGLYSLDELNAYKAKYQIAQWAHTRELDNL